MNNQKDAKIMILKGLFEGDTVMSWDKRSQNQNAYKTMHLHEKGWPACPYFSSGESQPVVVVVRLTSVCLNLPLNTPLQTVSRLFGVERRTRLLRGVILHRAVGAIENVSMGSPIVVVWVTSTSVGSLAVEQLLNVDVVRDIS